MQTMGCRFTGRSRLARRRAATAQTTTSTLLLLGTALLLLLSHAAQTAEAFAFVPVLYTFATKDISGSKTQSRLLCQQGGGYIAAEATAVLHQAVVNTARGAGAGTTWYAHLGATTEANARINCPLPAPQAGNSGGQSFGCYWRWNQGRWTETEDNADLPLYIDHVGVTFYVGNLWRPPQSSTVSVYGCQGGFPCYFDTSAAADRDKRPGMLMGQDLVAVGTSDTSTWSDNLASGGYSYAGYTYNRYYGLSTWNATAQMASQAYFWAVCQTQSASRTMYELENTSSDLQNKWWVIFLVVLFVVCLVAFLVVALCQDDEDMDEPPEDAPVWAQQEMQQAKHTKSFVSTRSFRGPTTHDDDYEGEDSHDGRRRGSGASDARSSSSRSSSRSAGQQKPQPQTQPQTQPQPQYNVANPYNPYQNQPQQQQYHSQEQPYQQQQWASNGNYANPNSNGYYEEVQKPHSRHEENNWM